MAAKTFYLINSKATGANHMKLQDGGSPPATVTTGTGWRPGVLAPTVYSSMQALTEVTSFYAGAKPDAAPNNTTGDCWRSEYAFLGLFASGDWTLHFPLLAQSANPI